MAADVAAAASADVADPPSAVSTADAAVTASADVAAPPSTVHTADVAGQEVQQAAAGDPQKPKRPLSAYWLFTNKVREAVTQEIKEKNNGKANFGEVAKTMSTRWAALSKEEKKEFEDQAEDDKQRYAQELKVYLEASDPAGTLRKKYEHLIPKKPMTAYFLFSQDPTQREKATAALKEAGVEVDNKKLASKLGEMWKATSAEEKMTFEERHKHEQGEFLLKQKEWQATPEFAEIERAASMQAEKRAADGQEEKDEGKSTKRSRSVPKQGKAKESKESPTTDKVQQQSPQSTAKKPRKASAARGPTVEPVIDADVLTDAGKLGLDAMLKNLAARPEVASSGKTARQMLQALQDAGGLVNPAKRALLSAAGA